MTCKHKWIASENVYLKDTENVFTGKPFGVVQVSCNFCARMTKMTLLCSVDDEDV